uniref:Fatty acyl-CoA reductase n=1 Tax=Anopheles coluzzii TaxID=1518534 RepID=A0A8W7Q3E7_ANOCL
MDDEQQRSMATTVVHREMMATTTTTAAAAASIAESYAGRSIFITGATGFMGKIMVEKLLRDCGELRCIYLLIRAKKGVDPAQRKEEYVKNIVFDHVRERYSERLGKIRLIRGDILSPGLGLSDDDRRELTENVELVFHCAANVRFDQHIRQAVDINLNGTIRVLGLAEQMRRLVSFVHVSNRLLPYILKEAPETLPKARKLLRKLYIMDKIVQIGLYLCGLWLAWTYLEVVTGSIQFVFDTAIESLRGTTAVFIMPQLKNARVQFMLTPLYTFRSFRSRSLYTCCSAVHILSYGPPTRHCIVTLTTFSG